MNPYYICWFSKYSKPKNYFTPSSKNDVPTRSYITAAGFSMTSLQSSTKTVNWQLEEEQQCSYFCAFLQIFILLLVFNCPRLVNGVSKENAVRIWCPGVWWREGLQWGVNHGKDNALPEHAWFLQENDFTWLLPLQLESAVFIFCSASEALRGLLTMDSYWFFWSCHQIVCGLNRD